MEFSVTKKLLPIQCICRTVFYGQYKCSGPGANQAGRATFSRELTDAEAAPFLSLNYIDGGLWGVSNLDS